MTTTKITKGESLREHILGAISETLALRQGYHKRALEEKDKQVSLGSKNTNDDEGETDFDSMKDDSKTDDSAALGGDVKLDDVIEKLNMIRSGKSLKDSLVTQRFDKYFSGLDTAERVAMFAFLKGIAQIVIGEIEPDQVVEPSDDPSKLKISREKDVKKKNVDPAVVKKPKQQVQSPHAQGTGQENTSAPVQAKKRG